MIDREIEVKYFFFFPLSENLSHHSRITNALSPCLLSQLLHFTVEVFLSLHIQFAIEECEFV